MRLLPVWPADVGERPAGKEKSPDDETIREAMSGNICRCGTYPRIHQAIREAAANMHQPSFADAMAPAEDRT